MFRAYRQLQSALFFCLVLHIIAPISMLALVLPGFDLVGSPPEARAAYIAASPWLWRLGWVPWQLCAAVDLWVSVALLRWVGTRPGFGAKAWATFAVVATVAAVIPDQLGEWVLVTTHVAEAQDWVQSGRSVSFLSTETWALRMTGIYGNDAYVLMTIGWTGAIASRVGGPLGGTCLRALWGATALVAAAFLVSGGVVWFAAKAPGNYPGLAWTHPLNGAGFLLLNMWTLLAAVLIGRVQAGAHPSQDSGLHAFKWPHVGWWGRWVANVVNEPGLRDLCRSLPFFPMRSDVRDVVYLNWMVPIDRVAEWLPDPLKLKRFGDFTPVTVLTYTHGWFGPSWLGSLRRFFPSPHQSNWRLYLDTGHDSSGSIYFFQAVIGSPVMAVVARLLSDALPVHLPATMIHERSGAALRSRFTPGQGSAPDLDVVVCVNQTPALPAVFADHFDGFAHAVRYLVDQNGAAAILSRLGSTVYNAIEIPIDISAVQACAVERFHSDWLNAVVGDLPVFAFVVPTVPFSSVANRLTIIDAER
jgi:hypothetical protein